MTENHHLSADLIGDLLDGSLAAAEAMAANSHLATCTACAQVRDDQVFVSALLAEEGRAAIRMPTDVAIALDAAILRAADERADGVVALEPVRRRRGPIRWLAGAAAAVAVTAIGVASWQLVDQGASTSSSADRAQPSSQQPSETSTTPPSTAISASKSPAPPTGPNGIIQGVRPVGKAQLQQRARHFADHPHTGIAPSALGCARPSGFGPSLVVRWDGRQAILALNTATRTAAILDCATAREMLYSTGY